MKHLILALVASCAPAHAEPLCESLGSIAGHVMEARQDGTSQAVQLGRMEMVAAPHWQPRLQHIVAQAYDVPQRTNDTMRQLEVFDFANNAEAECLEIWSN